MIIKKKVLQPNDAWIIFREDLDTIKEGHCNIYFLLDAFSNYVFGQKLAVDLPSKLDFKTLLQEAYHSIKCWPKQIWMAKNDPSLEMVKAVCEKLKINFVEKTILEIKPFVKELVDGFHRMNSPDELGHDNMPFSEIYRDEFSYFVPETYGPCPCASGKNFKFCCQPIFKDITLAMCGAEEGNLEEALHFMEEAERKVGQTAEVLCRYAIVWSFFNRKKFNTYLKQAQKINKNHPRTNYILGLMAVDKEQELKAIHFYQKAIDNYPKTDRFHLNETYNNLGTAYFRLGKYQEAKEAWEKGFVLLPEDEMIRRNLVELIYDNLDLPSDLRIMSPFIAKLFKS